MPERRAILLAVESYQDPDMPPAPHAETDAQALALALEAVGYPRDSQVVLLGAQATGTAIASRLRKLAKAAPETLLVSFTGHGFTADGVSYLACTRSTITPGLRSMPVKQCSRRSPSRTRAGWTALSVALYRSRANTLSG